MPNYYELIPELKSWEEHNNCTFSPEEWLGGVGRFDHAIAYLCLFWPQFIEHDGCLFIGEEPTEINHYKGFVSFHGLFEIM